MFKKLKNKNFVIKIGAKIAIIFLCLGILSFSLFFFINAPGDKLIAKKNGFKNLESALDDYEEKDYEDEEKEDR